MTDAEWEKRLVRFQDIRAVPYVAAWSGESEMYISHSVMINEPAIFRRPAKQRGRPILGKMDETRQREVMFRKLCQVCRAPIHGAPKFTIDDGARMLMPGTDNDYRPLVREPMACERCMRMALEICPGLHRHQAAGTLTIYRVRRFLLVCSYLGKAGNGDKLDQLLATYKGPPPVGYLKGLLTDFDVVAADLETVLP